MNSPFSPKTVLWLASVGAVLLALSVMLRDYEIDPYDFEGRYGPGAFSTSAVGYAGLFEALRRLGWEVKRGGDRTVTVAGRKGILVLAEPDLRQVTPRRREKYDRFKALLLVLPKWRGDRDAEDPRRIAEVVPAPLDAVRSTLGLSSTAGDVVRRPWPRSWRVNTLRIPPAGEGIAQTIRSPRLTPIVASEEGVLLGETVVDGRVIWVLTDPDVMANHGIASGENVEFMIAMLQDLAARAGIDPEEPVVFDEAVHGFQEHLQSPARLLLRPPFVVITILLCVAAALLFLAGGNRFGGIIEARPNLDFGKAALIANSARLLEYSGRGAETVWCHMDMILRQAGKELHAPAGLEGVELAKWLDEIGRNRGVAASCLAIYRKAGERTGHSERWIFRLLQCAREMHAWKGEILNGPGADKEDSRGRQDRGGKNHHRTGGTD